jgi:hypothetical protein
MKKSENMLVWLREMVLAKYKGQFAMAGKRYSNSLHLLKRV